jgi:hypothetical protein
MSILAATVVSAFLLLPGLAGARDLKIIFSSYTPPYVFEQGECVWIS